MGFVKQIWVLAQKDLLIVLQRRWLSTFIRALVFPVVLTVVLAYIRFWTSTSGYYGIGTPTPIKSFSDALHATGSTRPNVVIVDNGSNSDDINAVIADLTTPILGNGKTLHRTSDISQLSELCPSSNGGVSNCYGAVAFHSSPGQGPGQIWNYTIYSDSALGKSVDIRSNTNDLQLYQLPFQHAIDSAIASTQHQSQLLDGILQYPFTGESEVDKEKSDLRTYESEVQVILAYAFFVALSGLTYHCVGHITYQRERGMLQLIDAMMPNKRRWECIVARNLSTHFAFDLIYLPGWIIVGIVIGVVAFPHSNTGYFVAISILTGLALTSYSIIVSSLFKRAQLSAISAIIAIMVFALVAQFAEGSSTLTAHTNGVLATSVLFPPCNFVYFLVIAAGFAQDEQPLVLNKYAPNIQQWSVTGATVLGLLVFQIVVFPILGMMIESMLHSTASSTRKIRSGREMGENAVRLQGFTKLYKSRVKKKEKVTAVDNLNLNLHTGSITVLLGANGSGKSTTLNSIAGLETITQGEIEIDGEGGLGICPQKNVMWNELTVTEHVKFFEKLKSTTPKSQKAHNEAVRRLIRDCDLEVKSSARSATLSGGQKRKLQLAMMLAGDSRVCCIDEASSGIDPLARRKVWDILLSERGTRTLLLTTHFLDEAEVLSDHVAILSKGQLKAEGSVATLKSSMGGGYRVTVTNSPSLSSLSTMPGVTVTGDFNQTVFEVTHASTVGQLIAHLEQRGIRDYKMQGPTIEHVFLQLAHEMKAEAGLAQDLSVAPDNNDREQPSQPLTRTSTNQPLKLETGKGCSPLKQTWILFLKRLTVLRHNYMPYVAAMFIPLVLSGMVTRFFIGFGYPDGIPCNNPESNGPQTPSIFTLSPQDIALPAGEPAEFVFGPPERVSFNMLQSLVPNNTVYASYEQEYPPDWSAIPTVNTLNDFNNYIAGNAEQLEDGGFFDDTNTPTFAWSSGQYSDSTYPMFVQSLLNSVLLNQTIAFSTGGFAESFTPSNGVTSFVAVFIALGFSVYPGLFSLYPTAERLRNVRAMHYSNGILSSSLWLAYALFDFMFVLIISILTIAILTSKWSGWYAPGYMFVVFMLYGLASTAYSYVISLFVSSQLAAIAASSVIQVIIAMLYLIAYVLSAANAPAYSVYTWFNYCHYTIALICPAASLFRALFMALNNYSLVCRGTEKAAYPGEMSIYGAPILYLVVQFILLSAFLMYWESGRSLEVFGISRKRRNRTIKNGFDPEKNTTQSSRALADAVEDSSRLAPTNSGLRIMEVSKAFGKNLAVNDVTFGILPSEKFALLGPNGAGKSTMISLIRGDINPTHQHNEASEIAIANDSLMHRPVAAKNHLGVCPQFDATDSMTLREHLTFYARARGVLNRDRNIDELISRLGLGDHQKKMVKKLSGGTKRKLSLAIALIANPNVLLLDEPSSGMDPAAKRALWSTLSSISSGRVLLITTHSMEEADALCDRAGIMASRLLALGSIDELRQRHGNAIHIHLVHRDAPYTRAEDTERMRQWAIRMFPNAIIERRTFGGQLRFSVPKSGGQENAYMGRLFREIEDVKGDLGVVDYSIGPATLDQVFLNVVEKHDVKEENTDTNKGNRWKWYAKEIVSW